MATKLADVVNHSAYLAAVISTLVLLVWSIVHVYTKAKDGPMLTQMHVTLATISSACVGLLQLTLMHKFAK